MNDGLSAVLVHVLVHADLPHFMCGKLKQSNTTGPKDSAERLSIHNRPIKCKDN